MQQHLINYFKNGCLSRTDRILSFIYPQLLYFLNAGKVAGQKTKPAAGILFKQSYSIQEYDHNNINVKKLSDFLQKHLPDVLAGAYVHGSAATNELIPYSDIDALVILKDDVLLRRDKLCRTALKLKEAEQFMHAQDVLQHHGWFVLLESDLANYDNSYFPAPLFAYCKSILPGGLKQLNIAITTESRDQYSLLCKSILKKTADGRCPATMYDLKKLLSEFMLLPSVYIQHRDREAVFKKYSFEKARIDFKDHWQVMDDVSGIREEWQQDISAWRERLAARFSMVPAISNRIRTKVPSSLEKKIRPHISKMNYFAQLMCERMDLSAKHKGNLW